jgi:hypothetical protein
MSKAILLLDADGVALAPATLCAEAAEEARNLKLPLFDEVFADLSSGKELQANGDSTYDLFHDGERVGILEVFEAPRARDLSAEP